MLCAHDSISGFSMFNQNYFSVVQKKVKKHYSQKILQCKYDIKKRLIVMKEIIGNAKDSKKSNFSGNLKLVTK